MKKSKSLPDTNFFKIQLRRIGSFPGHIQYSINRVGGIHKMLIKALKIFRHEGLSGIRARFKKIVKLRENKGNKAYQKWIKNYDTLTVKTKARMRGLIKKNSSKPLISILITISNTKSEWLIEAVESIRNQVYPHWELSISVGASIHSDIRPILERYAAKDRRIKIAISPNHTSPSVLSNLPLKLVKGAWIILLNSDDQLSEQALFWIVRAINENPQGKLIYSDEDEIDEISRRKCPHFKTDWNVDLFYSTNFMAHSAVYNAKLLKKVGGFRPGFEGAQEFDLALRCLERIKPNQICHIPRILYHWRTPLLNTPKSAENKAASQLAGQKALNEHFKRQHINAKVETTEVGLRVRYSLPPQPPLVSLIIPTRNGFKLIKTCIDSILKKTTYPHYEIIVVDNGSDDPKTLGYLKELEGKVRIIRDDRPFNYSALNNMAVKSAKGEIVGLINNDLEVISPDWLSEMVSHALRPEIGAVGARLWYPNNTLQHGGVIIGIGGVAGHGHKHITRSDFGYFGRAVSTQALSAVTAACLVVRKSIYNEVGGLNEKNLKVAYNDVDFCLRIQEKGYRNLFTPYAELYHHESATRGYENNPEKRRRLQTEIDYMYERWGDQLLNDPAYNPNLTLKFENFSYAWPPRIKTI